MLRLRCKKFASSVHALVRNRPADAERFEAALAHAAECAECARRLASAQALALALHGLAVEDERDGVPEELERDLVIAFRQHFASKERVAIGSLPARTRSLRYAWLLAVCALFVTGLLIAYRQSGSNRSQSVQDERAARAERHELRASGSPAIESVVPEKAVSKKGSLNVVRKGVRRGESLRQRRERAPGRREIDEDSIAGEIATEFIPLVPPELFPFESGQIVRVELPRAALVSLGWPINAERSGEWVRADVVIGADGLARAVRFVR
jgi:hypothetical protein